MSRLLPPSWNPFGKARIFLEASVREISCCTTLTRVLMGFYSSSNRRRLIRVF